MTFFENGVRLQRKARTKEWAIHTFEESCVRCCTRGIHMDCRHCAIAGAHEKTMQRLELVAR